MQCCYLLTRPVAEANVTCFHAEVRRLCGNTFVHFFLFHIAIGENNLMFPLLYYIEAIFGFNPLSYTFADGMGAVSLTLEISGLPGDLERDIEVNVNLIDGTNAGKI